MNSRSIIMVLLLPSIILAGVTECFAKPQYLTSIIKVYGEGECGTCHVRASGGDALNSYGSLFEYQPNHAANASAALQAIGRPQTLSPIPTLTPIDTPVERRPFGAVSNGTPIAALTPAITVSPTITTESDTVTSTTSGFGIVASLVGILSLAILVKRNKS